MAKIHGISATSIAAGPGATGGGKKRAGEFETLDFARPFPQVFGGAGISAPESLPALGHR